MFTPASQLNQGEDFALFGLDQAEVDEFREWLCYTKPIGPSIRIVAPPVSQEPSVFCAVTAGTEPGPPVTVCPHRAGSGS
jgi:hypothetical protein